MGTWRDMLSQVIQCTISFSKLCRCPKVIPSQEVDVGSDHTGAWRREGPRTEDNGGWDGRLRSGSSVSKVIKGTWVSWMRWATVEVDRGQHEDECREHERWRNHCWSDVHGRDGTFWQYDLTLTSVFESLIVAVNGNIDMLDRKFVTKFSDVDFKMKEMELKMENRCHPLWKTWIT